MRRLAIAPLLLMLMVWGCDPADGEDFDAAITRADGSITPVDGGSADQATGFDSAAGVDSAVGIDTATGIDASTDCADDCSNLVYNACTCGAADPCDWAGDGYCDLEPVGASCDQFSPHFDDSADCQGALDAGGFDATGYDAARPDAWTDPGVELNDGWVGGACTSALDCDDDSYTVTAVCELDADGFAGGMCTQPCTESATAGHWVCPDADSYGSGTGYTVTRCIEDDAGDPRCVAECDFDQSPSGCRPGYACVLRTRYNEPQFIYPICLPIDGQRWPGEAEPAFDIGAACSVETDCNHLSCQGLPGGYCSKTMCDVAGCPAGSTCYGFGEGDYLCLKDCSADGQCRTGDDHSCIDSNDPDSAPEACWYEPPDHSWDPSVGTADCAAALAAGLSPCDLVVDNYVVVNKAARNMAQCDSSGSVVNNFSTGLSSFAPFGDKERSGDGKTPEGVFYIPRLVPDSSYYKAFLISYPDAEDAARGLSNGWISQSVHDQIVSAQSSCTEPPQQSELGGLIEIHGMGGSSDWTLGCMAIENSEVDILWAVLDVGDSVVVLPD